ncbi:MAG: shikimate dehydrogenase [Chitinophagaceae bacterium]|jgi:shikimate dehydrogenase
MEQYGIIGFPLTHSFSPAYFNEKFTSGRMDCAYNVYQIDSISQLPGLIKAKPELCGLNVTIPYKTAVIQYLDFISESAQAINAVNCVKIVDGKLFGFNTDHFGFTETLKPLLNKEMNKALVLGTGGSSKAVCFALSQLGIEYKLVSASGKGDLSYNELTEEILQENLLLVNTTPLGMFPETDQCPTIPYPFLCEKHLLYDLIYNPKETVFLRKGREQKTAIKNGYEMLIAQADKSWEIWNDDNAINKTISLK